MSTVDNYYTARVNQDDDPFWQVGKTVGGKPVAREHLELIVGQIAAVLRLERTDVLLDLGCGNGLVTREVASLVGHVTGVEQNTSLYQVALRDHNVGDVVYVNSSIFNMHLGRSNFNKAYLYEVIQHIPHARLTELIRVIFDGPWRCAKLFIGSVPDEEKKWNFYDSKERRCSQLRALQQSGDPLGTWYHKDHLMCLGETYGLKVTIIPQPEALYTSHYRFDCLFEAP